MKKIVCVALIITSLAIPSFADLAIVFDYFALTGDYRYNSTLELGTLTVQDTAASKGSIDRILPTVGTADFYSGNAKFLSQLAVSSITPNSAIGEGTMSMTDIDGTTLDLLVSGFFRKSSNERIYFDGIITQAAFGGDNDGNVEGDNGSFDTTFNAPLSDGTVIQFNVASPWFNNISSFSGKLSRASGELYADANSPPPAVVPAPAALVMAGIGLGCIGWVKRRFN